MIEVRISTPKGEVVSKTKADPRPWKIYGYLADLILKAVYGIESINGIAFGETFREMTVMNANIVTKSDREDAERQEGSGGEKEEGRQ